MVSPQPALRQSRERHLHVANERCPVCDQPIPNEKAEEVRARMEARERSLAEAANARAAQQIVQEKARIEAAANATVERLRKENDEALKKTAAEAAAKVEAARAEGRKAAEVALQERVAAAEKAKTDAAAAAAQKIAAIEQAASAREAASQEKITATDTEKRQALAQLEALKTNQEKLVSERVQEAREAMEKDKTDALGAERSKHFEDRQKLTDKLDDLRRQLERKTADELGEGAEVNLFEALKAEFDNDKIERIGKGTPGADIRHVVMHNRKECGTIIYDSKNSRRWLSDYVDKLARDQRAARAEYAILSTLKLPDKTRQVHVDKGTGIIVANPARVLALVQVLRRHIVHVHTLRLSNTERVKKTAALYDFITSEPCTRLLDSIDKHAEDLFTLQVKEQEAHRRTWTQQGTLYRSIQKVRADLGAEIDRIIGTDDPAV